MLSVNEFSSNGSVARLKWRGRQAGPTLRSGTTPSDLAPQVLRETTLKEAETKKKRRQAPPHVSALVPRPILLTGTWYT